MPLNMVSMAIYVTLEGKIPRTPHCISSTSNVSIVTRRDFEGQSAVVINAVGIVVLDVIVFFSSIDVSVAS